MSPSDSYSPKLSPPSLPRQVQIIVIEDDPGHMRLIERNLKRAGIMNNILQLKDGQEAMDYLFPNGNSKDWKDPALILLDLNLPVFNGIEILDRMKSDPKSRHIPVIVLTTTDDEREIERCYELGCNIYVTKPVEYEAFSEAIRKLGFLFSIITIPAYSNE